MCCIATARRAPWPGALAMGRGVVPYRRVRTRICAVKSGVTNQTVSKGTLSGGASGSCLYGKVYHETLISLHAAVQFSHLSKDYK